MRALVWDGRSIQLQDIRQPVVPGPQWTRVRVAIAGICSTDLQILAGYMGFRGVPGHEFVGVVEEGPGEFVGSRVVGEINQGCGCCAKCAAGNQRHCADRKVLGILGLDGAFAENVLVRADNLHRLPDSIPDEVAVFAEPLAAAIRAEEQSRGFAGERSLVLGAGKLGLLVAQVLADRGDRVIVGCRDASSSGRVVRDFDLAAQPVGDLEGGFRLVVDATGSEAGLGIALEHVAPEGAIVLKTTVAGCHSLDLSAQVIKEVTVIGSRCGRFPPALEALGQGAVRTRPLVSAVFPLEAGEEAVRMAGRSGVGKVLLRP